MNERRTYKKQARLTYAILGLLLVRTAPQLKIFSWASQVAACTALKISVDSDVAFESCVLWIDRAASAVVSFQINITTKTHLLKLAAIIVTMPVPWTRIQLGRRSSTSQPPLSETHCLYICALLPLG